MSTQPLVIKVLEYRSKWSDDAIVKQALISFNGLKPEEADAVIAEANAQITAVAVAEPVALPAIGINNRPSEVVENKSTSAPMAVTPPTASVVADVTTTQEPAFDPFVDLIETERQVQSIKPTLTFFESIALPLAARGWKVAPCQPNDKTVHMKLVPKPLTMRSNDPAQIHAWGLAEPNANVCVYAEQVEGGLLFLDKDGAVSLREKYERETGKPFPKTLLVRSSVIDDGNGGTIAKGHWYFYQTPRTLMLKGNIAESKSGGLFSLRVHNQYVASIGSIHPKTGEPYIIAEDDPVIPMPDDLLDWLLKQVVEEKAVPTNTQAQSIIVTEGGRNTHLASMAGKARQDLRMNEDELLAYLRRLNSEECQPPLPDSEVQTIAGSIAKYGIKPGAFPLTQQAQTNLNQRPNAAPIQVDDLSWLDTTGMGSRPEFPRWVMEGTSLYENLAKPVSDVNSKYPELIWLPAVQVLLNRLSGNLRIEMIHLNLNMFLGSISEPGRFFKSSSCRLGHEFFKQIGLVDQYDKKLEKGTSSDKTIVMQTGSSEGFGLTMQKIGTRKAILFNDELGKLTAKIGIENSSFPHDLLSWYESDYFGNTVSNANRNFAFEAGNYCFSWQFCSTTRSFNNQWSKIAGIVSGLLDRMFFLLSPPEPKTLTKEVHVPLLLGAEKTAKLINRALTKGIYSVDSGDALERAAAEFGDPRSMNLVYKLALAIAVDLGLETIDDDAVERALALVKYRQDVIRYLAPIEARTEEGRVQQEIVRELRQNGGKMTRRNLTRNLHSELYGSRFWNGAYCGLINDLRIHEFTEMGGHGNLKKMVGVVKESVRFGDDE